jgi:hypothetical protein
MLESFFRHTTCRDLIGLAFGPGFVKRGSQVRNSFIIEWTKNATVLFLGENMICINKR